MESSTAVVEYSKPTDLRHRGSTSSNLTAHQLRRDDSASERVISTSTDRIAAMELAGAARVPTHPPPRLEAKPHWWKCRDYQRARGSRVHRVVASLGRRVPTVYHGIPERPAWSIRPRPRSRFCPSLGVMPCPRQTRHVGSPICSTRRK